MSFLMKHKLAVLGIVLGAAGGYLYYHYIGCTTGSCPITSRPVNSTLYGAMMGWLLFTSFTSKESKPTNNANQK